MRYYANTLGIIGLTALAGCSSMIDHSNTLVFGTETTLAIDASQSATTQTPQVTVGYKRVEAVWMPLLANKGKSSDREAADCSNDCRFESGDGKDSYSVLASFGAKFGGEADANVTTGTDAKYSNAVTGGIAQYFATGIAAQKLAAKGGSSLVSVQSGNVAQAEAEADMLKKENANITAQLKEYENRLGITRVKEINEQALKNKKEDDGYISVIINKLAPDGKLDQAKLGSVIDDPLLKNAEITRILGSKLAALKTKTKVEDVKEMLEGFGTITLSVDPLEMMVKELLK